MSQRNPVHRLIDEFRELYLKLTKPVIEKINKKVQSGMDERQAVKQVFESENLIANIDNLIQKQVIAAGAIGYGVDNLNNEKAYLSFFNKEFQLSKQTVSLPLQAIVRDEIRISLRKSRSYIKIATRLEGKNLINADIPKWLNDFVKATKKNVSDTALKNESIKAAKQLNRLSLNGAPNKSLKAAYKGVIDKAINGTEKQIEKSIQIALQEKARYNAERIARTEIARSSGMAHDFKALNDDDVVGVEYNLSNRHKIYDICDFHTSANLYGMGPGIYPKNNHPRYPFHPHCTCVPNEVFVGEAEVGQYDPKKGDSWIKGRSKQEKKSLLGVKGSKTFNKGGRWQNNLNNWEEHEKVSIEGLRKSMFE